MAKISKVQYTGTTGISIAGGKHNTTKVPMFPEGRIVRVYTKQTSGSAAAFTVDILDYALLPLGDSSAAIPANIELYRIIPQQSLTSGSTLALYEIPEGYAYRNQDGTQTLPVRAIYLVISPTAAGTTVWEASVTVESMYAV